MIKAEVHSDDFIFKEEFDATKWFEQASEKEILDLAKCDWGGDYPADNVARESVDWFDGIANVLDYCTRKTDMGFECHVDGDEALTWLRNNRPLIYRKIDNGESKKVSRRGN